MTRWSSLSTSPSSYLIYPPPHQSLPFSYKIIIVFAFFVIPLFFMGFLIWVFAFWCYKVMYLLWYVEYMCMRSTFLSNSCTAACFFACFLWISLLKIEFFINACSFYEGITFVIQLMLLIIVLVSWFKGFLFWLSCSFYLQGILDHRFENLRRSEAHGDPQVLTDEILIFIVDADISTAEITSLMYV